MNLILLWACSSSYQALDLAQEAVISSETVTIIDEDWISFYPTNPISTDIGVVFYPGGKVEPEAYAPILREIAEMGMETHILRPPLDLAIMNQDQAYSVMETETPTQWIVAGHSLGGVAASYICQPDQENKRRYPENKEIIALSLWASYPADSVDLSTITLPVQSLLGSKDAVVNSENYENSAERLPSTTDWIVIEGGNHSQFGDYGLQEGDNTADISNVEQWNIVSTSMFHLVDVDITAN